MENLSHSIISLIIVIAALGVFGIRQPASRIKFLLIPVVLPAMAAPLYYLISPDRFGLPVLDVDDWLNIEAVIERSGHSVLASYAFAFVILAVVSFVLFKGIISLAAVVWLPRRYPCVSSNQHPHIYSILDRVLKIAHTKRPLILLYPGHDILCCAFGFRQPYLLVSKGALKSLSEDDLEAVVAHEIGHIQRWDSWLGFIVLTFRNIFFF
ncbi:MAG: M56 family metallopeptidase, partial [Dehalococcoidia bacterium]|nr:M56 family metallopeptidase [Dehalococcoidia bacterium]